ncbi:hypothetical protein BDZ89DRAFT_1136628 [Hymenopellis radicata]|nr:hypothetical protein BDZ89DRAFT_1136628 [Hymenopellis radicata]
MPRPHPPAIARGADDAKSSPGPSMCRHKVEHKCEITDLKSSDAAIVADGAFSEASACPTPLHTPIPNADHREEVRQRAEQLEQLVADFADGTIPSYNEFLRLARETGASAGELDDYVEQVVQIIAAREEHHDGSAPPDPDLAAQQAEQQAALKRAVEEAAWAALGARLDAAAGKRAPEPGPVAGPTSAALLSKLLGAEPTPSGISASVLSSAPHLAQLASPTNLSPHLQETQRLRRLFTNDKDVDAIINVCQTQSLHDLFARSLWRSIVLDQYVDFEKLYASIHSGTNQQEDTKDFAGGFVLIRKDHVSARRALTQESEWTRVFDAYATGVGLIYPHRKDELQGYRVLIVELFRATPSNPAFPIRCDKETRTRYANSPFNLNDRNALQLPLLTEMLRTSEAANPRKRSSDSSSSQPATRRR